MSSPAMLRDDTPARVKNATCRRELFLRLTGVDIDKYALATVCRNDADYASWITRGPEGEMNKIAVTLAEAEELAGVSRFSLRRQIKTGKLQVARIGRRLVVPVSELEKLLRPVLGPDDVKSDHNKIGDEKHSETRIDFPAQDC